MKYLKQTWFKQQESWLFIWQYSYSSSIFSIWAGGFYKLQGMSELRNDDPWFVLLLATLQIYILASVCTGPDTHVLEVA